jgi:hypothetical protein
MLVGIQIAILVSPPGLLLAGCGPELDVSPSRLDLAACAGMSAGAIAHHYISRSARPVVIWTPLLAGMAAMLMVHPPGIASAVLSGAPLAAFHIALLMMPAMLLAHGTVSVLASVAANRTTRPLVMEGSPDER